MFSRFFIDRPIFATVLSIVITLAGALSVFTLPLAQFPRISPPTVTVTANYPGASAQDVASAVAAPIEQYVNGVEGMMYMSSQCTNDGAYNLTVTFHQGIDLDMAQVLVQNRVTMALPSLPDVIKATGVATRKRSPDILMGIAILSPNKRYDQLYLSNFALRRIKDELARLPGVGDVFLFGQRDFCMRVWLDPNKMTFRGLSANDVVRAIRDQNVDVATGMIGQPPNPPSPPLDKGGNGGSPPLGKGGEGGVEQQLTISTLGRLREVEQFENIILRTTADGRVLRVKDVARVELGSKNQDVDTNMDGQPTVFLAIFQAPDGNALETHDAIIAKMEELGADFPEDVAYDVGFTTVPYTRESIREVFITLRDAIILVALVVLLFLQNWRSAIIPLIAVPVAIVGTFAVMAAFGFSLNNLTLFGLVLAIGIVVDDAIVVVEAVEHHIEEGLAPRDAALAAMRQVSGPVIAVGLVLSAVFIPCAFISGITGLFFRQFALTISASTIISAINSLTLSPALAALLLRPLPHKGAKNGNDTPPLPRWFYPLVLGLTAYLYLGPYLGPYLVPYLLEGWARLEPFLPIDGVSESIQLAAPWIAAVLGVIVGWLVSRPINALLAWTFSKFNTLFGMATHGYTSAVGKLLRFSVIALLLYGGLVGLTGYGFMTTPKGFIPNQDMGYLMVIVQLPDSASMERTREVMRQLDEITRKHPGVKHATTISGQSFALQANGSNFGSMFVNLREYAQRRDPSMASDAIANWLRKEFGEKIFDASVQVFGPPPVRGVGRAGGFAFVIEDRGDLGPAALQEYTDAIARAGNQQPGLIGLFSVFRANVPQLQVEPDLRECASKGVSPGDFADTLRTYQGSLYVNDFNLFGRTWQVVVQAEPEFRNRVEYLTRYTVRNNQGAMVPIGSVASVKEVNGPLILNRYNMYPAATINGMAGPGLSSRQAIDYMQSLANRELPPALAYEWTDMSYLELQAGNTAMRIFGYAVLMVFLVLAAQYESWSLPLAVILVVPMCLLSAIVGVRLASMDINIFTQIGFVVLVGLSSKNAILIVEFAKHLRESGVPRREATLEACRLRLRPIVMTSLAFILGVVPLMVSTGAGAEMRRTLGTAVFAGMVGVTLFGIFLTPVFFYVINQLAESHWLNTPAMRRVQDVLLGIFGLRYVKRLASMALRRSNVG